MDSSISPALAAILKKAKTIDEAARAYDTNPEPRKPSSGGGLFDGVSGGQTMMNESPTMDVNSEMYQDAVKKTGLPPAIQEAMINDRIPQPSSSFDVDDETIRGIRGFDENDMREVPETSNIQRRPKRMVEQTTPQQMVGVDENTIRKIVNEEIKKVLPKVLPKVVEHYIQKGLLKESMEVLKNVKTTSVSKRR
jgi:hypothetical protein